METDKIIVGRLLGVADTGLYFMTQRIGVLPTRELISPLQRILFPSYSELTHDMDRFRRAALESINILGSLSLPAAFGFALVANDFVPLVLGDQWIVIVPLLIILVPYLGVRATLSMTLPCVMALGRTQLLFWVSLVYALVHLPAFIAGTAVFGLTGAIWSIVLAGVFYSYLNVWLLRHTLDISFASILVQLRRPFGATVLMAGVVVAFGAMLPIDLFSNGGSWLSLVTKTIVGGLVFGAAQIAIWRIEGRPDGIERRLLQVLSRRGGG
jgi:O-antigen/teichoic acid export membrane protein